MIMVEWGHRSGGMVGDGKEEETSAYPGLTPYLIALTVVLVMIVIYLVYYSIMLYKTLQTKRKKVGRRSPNLVMLHVAPSTQVVSPTGVDLNAESTPSLQSQVVETAV